MKTTITFILALVFSTSSFAMGSKQPKCPAETEFTKEFDAETVVALADQAYKHTRHAHFLVDMDSATIPHQSAGDLFTSNSLYHLENQLPWISIKVKKNPENPRCATWRQIPELQLQYKYLNGFWELSHYTVPTKSQIEKADLSIAALLEYYQLKTDE
jgi:hypothetical protein